MCWHKWKYYGKVDTDYFDGEKYYKVNSLLWRTCEKCGQPQKHWFTMSGDGWDNMKQIEYEIFQRHIKDEHILEDKEYTQEELKELYNRRN